MRLTRRKKPSRLPRVSLRAALALFLLCAGVGDEARADWTAADCGDGYGQCYLTGNQKRKGSTASDPCKKGHTSGDPVDTYSGAFVHRTVDLTIPGRGIDVEIRRTYRNSGQFNGPFGYNWTFGYYLRARKLTSGNYLVITESGHELVFHAEGSNSLGESSYCGCEYYSHLIAHADGTLTLFGKDASRVEFNQNGAVTALADRFGNTIRFEYLQDAGVDVKPPIAGKSKYFLTTGTGVIAREYQLVRIIDTYGRDIFLTYYGPADGSKMGRLKQITDFAGRALKYDYDDAGNLIAVTAPATDEFPSGTTTRYTYTVNDPNEALNHNLLSIIDGRNRTVLVNSYNADDRMTSQSHGGGTTTWSYDTTLRRTTVTDGSGNVAMAAFHQDGMLGILRQFTRGLRPGEPPYYDTNYSYDANQDLATVTYPRGNKLHYVRSPEGNILTASRVPVDGQIGGADDIVTGYTYEPIYKQVATMTDPRGFVTTHTFDYQEGNDTAGLAARLRVSTGEIVARLTAAGIPMNLGDVNDDGRIDQIGGRVVRIDHPTVTIDGSPQESRRLFSFNDHGQMLTFTDPEDHVTTLDYHPSDDPDGDGNTVPGPPQPDHGGYLKSITRAAGDPAETTTAVVYDPAGNPATLTDGRGNVTTLTFDERNRLARIVAPAPFLYEARAGYDAAGNVQQIEVANTNEAGVPDPANPWFTHSFAYDDFERLISRSREIDPGSVAVESYLYSPTGKPIQVTRPEGNRVRFEYDERDRLLRRRDGYGTPLEAVTTFNYSLNGRVTQIVDARNHTTELQYDDVDRIAGITNALGHHIDIAYDPSNHPISLTVTSSAGLLVERTDRQYDERGRLMEENHFLLDGSGQPTGSADLRLIHDRADRLRQVIDPDSRHVFLDYDAANRLVELRDDTGNRENYTYDPAGNIVTRVFTDVDEETAGLNVIDVDYGYDAMNRLTQITDMLGRTTQVHYNSRSLRTQIVDRAGNTARWTFDGLRRPRSMTRDLRDAGGEVIGSVVANYTFDRNSRLSDITGDAGEITRFNYDALDRVTSIVHAFQTPSAETESFGYDATGNRTSRQARNGLITNYVYDDINRMTSQSGGPVIDTYQYDALNRLTQGVVTHQGLTESTVQVAYDSLGRLIRETQNGEEVSSAFDGAGNRTRLDYPAGYFVTESTAPSGHLDEVRGPADELIAAFDYLGPRRLKRRVDGNGTTLTSTYDAVGRESSHTFTNGIGMQSTGFQYGHDRAGHRLFEERTHDAGAGDVYGYDSLYRLRQGWSDSSATDIQNIRNAIAGGSPIPSPVVFGGSTSYTLDDMDNRTSVNRNGSIASYLRNARQEYTVAEGAPHSHDNGNLVDDGVHLYAYDYLNRLRSVRRKSDNGLVATYMYDAIGRRIAKQFPAGTEVRYFYDRARLVEERNQSGALLAQYVYGTGVDQPLVMIRGGQTYGYQDNGLGSIAAITDSQGGLVERYSYDHFGNPTIRNAAGTVIASSLVGNSWMFTGRQYDAESGLYHYRARYLSPTTGRFLSVDPLGPRHLGNPYAYVLNDPVNLIDPWGLDAEPAPPWQPDAMTWINLPFEPEPIEWNEYQDFIDALNEQYGEDDAQRLVSDDYYDIVDDVGEFLDNTGDFFSTTEKFAGKFKNFADSVEMFETWVDRMPDGTFRIIQTTETSGGRFFGGIAGFAKKGAAIAEKGTAIVEAIQATRSLVQMVEDPEVWSKRSLEGEYGTPVQAASMVGHLISGEHDKILAASEHNFLGQFGMWLGEEIEALISGGPVMHSVPPPWSNCK